MPPMPPQPPAPPTPPNLPPDMQNPDMMQGAPEQPEAVSPEQKKALMDLLVKVQERMQNFHATNFAAKNKVEVLRRQLLQEVFQKLQMAGVDLSSRESVAAFISKLQESNPDMAQAFERAMSVLLGGPETNFSMPTPEAVPPSDTGVNQNQDETQNQAPPTTL